MTKYMVYMLIDGRWRFDAFVSAVNEQAAYQHAMGLTEHPVRVYPWYGQ